MHAFLSNLANGQTDRDKRMRAKHLLPPFFIYLSHNDLPYMHQQVEFISVIAAVYVYASVK